jgi:hypothetical protein
MIVGAPPEQFHFATDRSLSMRLSERREDAPGERVGNINRIVLTDRCWRFTSRHQRDSL